MILLILLSFVSIYVQTGVPIYTLRRDIKFNIIDDNKKVIELGVNFVISKLGSIIKNYNEKNNTEPDLSDHSSDESDPL